MRLQPEGQNIDAQNCTYLVFGLWARSLEPSGASSADDTEAPIASIAQPLGIGESVLRRWVEATRPQPAEQLSEDERRELARLRRENLPLRIESNGPRTKDGPRTKH